MVKAGVSLIVNSKPIPIDNFTQQFIKAVVTGILDTLKKVEGKGDIQLSIDGDKVDITTGSNTIPLNPFVRQFVKNTIIGMLSPLKGVGRVDRAEISIIRD